MVAPREPRRGDVLLVQLDPVVGHEIRKTRPCLVVSPDDLNAHLRTYLVAPMTTGAHPWPTRVPCRFQGKTGHVVLDQLRSIDRDRIVQRLGRVSPAVQSSVLAVLQELFAA